VDSHTPGGWPIHWHQRRADRQQRPEEVECPLCGKRTRGLRDHITAKHVPLTPSEERDDG